RGFRQSGCRPLSTTTHSSTGTSASPGGAINATPCGGSPVCPRTGGVIRLSAGNAVFSDHPRRVGRH
ncbi:hypothetical protein, partial [Photorhabdus sp. RM105S]|uniref:hypothetical protein n=1 Tax=Photorhabdus sp. RM105S TaxID=3342823 RepID=UPI0036DC159F